MLKWYLSTRGYPVGSYHVNKRTLYLLVRLDGHEGNYLSYLDGLLPAEVWYAWHEVLKKDLEIADLQRIWPVAKRFFARPFAELVECTLAGRVK